MKIGIDARMYGSKVTGIGNYVQHLIGNLAKIDSENQYFIFLMPEQYDSTRLPANFKKVKTDIPWYSWAEQLLYPGLIKQQGLDLMHFTNFNVPIMYRGKFVITIHDATPLFFPGPNVRKSIVRKLGYQATFNFGVKKASTIITPSAHTKKHLIGYFKVASEKIKVTPLGLNRFIKVSKDDKILKKYGIIKPFLLYVGVWRDHKNLTSLIKAFEDVKAKHDIQLILAGTEDKAYPEIRQAINRSRFKSDIITPGFVPDPDLPGLYAQAEIYVLPSFNEGFGLGALEAISQGTPVVASNTTSVPEILQDGALYFSPHKPSELAQAIDRFLTQPELGPKLAARGLKQIKSFNWSKTAAQTLVIYQHAA